MATSKVFEVGPSVGDQLTFSWAEPPASLSASQGSEAGLPTHAVASRSLIYRWLTTIARDGSSGKMSPVSFHQTEGETLEPSSGGWLTSGISSRGESWMLNTLEFHSGVVESSLSDILETGEVPQKFFLSPKACKGILRRAKNRGKTLPEALETALLDASRPERQSGKIGKPAR